MNSMITVGGSLTAAKKPPRLILCGGDSCKHGRKKVRCALEHALEQHGLTDQVEIRVSGCQDRCKHGPNLTVMPGAFLYSDLSPKRATAIVERHVASGEPAEELLGKRKKKKSKKER